jgi:hypothetical protein
MIIINMIFLTNDAFLSCIDFNATISFRCIIFRSSKEREKNEP